MVELAAVFNNAIGDRLIAANRVVLALPDLFGKALCEVGLFYRKNRINFIAVGRFEGKDFGPALEARFLFWVAGAGGTPLNLSALHASDLATFTARLEQCDVRERQVKLPELPEKLDQLMGQVGGGPNRRTSQRVRAEVEVKLGKTSTVTYDLSEGGLFLPSAYLPPMGDRFHLLLHVPGAPAPFDLEVRVTHVRTAAMARSGLPAGYGLAFVSPPDELKFALARYFSESKPPAVDSRRVHTRYPVSAPASLTRVDEPESQAPPPPSRIAQTREAVLPPQVLDLPLDRDKLKDNLDNLSRGGAFVVTRNPPPLNSKVILQLNLPGAPPLAAPARVVHLAPTGVGVQFELSEEQQEVIDQVIFRLSQRPQRALLVDDDPLWREMLSDALVAKGFEVLTACDGAAATHVLLDELLGLDVMVTDIHMPNMGGEALLRFVRLAGGESELLVVVLSGSELSPDEKARLKAQGVDEVFEKGAGAAEIASTLSAMVERRRARVG